MKPLLVITGPTASGKSSLAIEAAKEFNGEVISADSAQIYKELSIITARTLPEQMQNVPHHLSGFLNLEEDFSLAAFQSLAYEKIRDILSRGRLPILAGGTVLYIKAVVEAYDLPDAPPDEEFRKDMNRLAESEGKEAVYSILLEKDPGAAEIIHPNNLPRAVRALEVIKATGRKFSELYGKKEIHPLGVKPGLFCVDLEREILYERINSRVEQMFEKGAEKETFNLILAGKKEILKRRRILGCSELISAFEGYMTLEETKELVKRNTRRFAKRQLTWFRSMNEIIRLPRGKENLQKNLSEIRGYLSSF